MRFIILLSKVTAGHEIDLDPHSVSAVVLCLAESLLNIPFLSCLIEGNELLCLEFGKKEVVHSNAGTDVI